MSSEAKFTPVSYTVRQNQILTGNTPCNGRINLEEPENPDARFQMFERIAIKNKSTEYRDPLRGKISSFLVILTIQTPTPQVLLKYFSSPKMQVKELNFYNANRMFLISQSCWRTQSSKR